MPHITPLALYEQVGLLSAPTIVDLRGEDAFHAFARRLPGAHRSPAAQIAQWAKTFSRHRPVVVYGADDTVDKEPLETLMSLGLDVQTLEGGIRAWREAGYVTVRDRTELHTRGGSRWVTRERPKIDRLACPWLVRRFIDPDAQFFYTPAARVRSDAETLGAQPYDIADVTFSHRGDKCSFDAFLDEFDLRDPVLDEIADIVRAADTGELAQSPQAPGLLAISIGMGVNVVDDVVLMEQAMIVYDALYAWCKTSRHETHSWPQKTY